jgi:putative nucleotidyltransferase with HDIG domain
VKDMYEAKNLFNSYYGKFDISQSGIYRKYDHTMRVVDYAEEIAKSLDLSEEDIELAKKCALFHDIARFKQWDEYKTFEDSRSFDHGDEGYNILKELGVDDEIILLSTKYHNKYEVGDEVDYRTKIFCNITRDADKLDIMMEQKNICEDTEYDVAKSAVEDIKNHQQVHNLKNIPYTDATYILRCIAFIFDLNYKKSFEIIKETDIVNKKFDLILEKFDEDEMKELKSICNKYINERISD